MTNRIDALVNRIDALVAASAAAAPGRTAVIDADGTALDYAAYDAAIDAAADLLRAEGVGPGDRVVIVGENCTALAVAIFAASRIDAIACPVNARMTAAEIARVMDHARPRLALFTTAVSAEAAAHAAAAGATARDLGFGALALAATTPDAPEEMPQDAGAVAVLLYTTGTTGAPKGVMLTHGNLLFAGVASVELRGLVATDRIYGALPLTHVFGLASMLMAAARAGAAVQFEPRFRPDRLLAALREGVTVLPAVPQMHALLMQHTAEAGIARLEGAALRYVSSGAAPLDPAWKRKAEAFYGLALQNGYGMTESTAGVCGTRNPIGSPDTSVGPPLPGIEIRIDASVRGADMAQGAAPTGAEAPAGTGAATAAGEGAAAANGTGTGEILTRGPHVMKGYFRNPDETAKAIGADGFLRTGDLGRIDAEGRLHVVGRCKELIIRSGFNVYPPEVEAALNDHPQVVQSAVIGRRIEGGNEEVLAFVQCADPAAVDPEDLRAFVAARLASYKRPGRIVLTDRLPAAATGKVLKHRLLEEFAEALRDPAPGPAPR